MPSNDLKTYSRKEMALMLINYQKERIKALEGREKWLISMLILAVCALAGVKIGVI